MKLSSILLARVVAFFEISELKPRGAVFFPDVTRELVKRYGFQKFPKNYDEWESEKGAEFITGKIGDEVIGKLILWNTGITIETRSGTEMGKDLLIEMLDWAKKNFSLAEGPEIIRDWAYISDLSFYSDVPLLSTGPKDRLAERISAELQSILKPPLDYLPLAFSIGHDPLLRKHGRAPFTIQRRADTPFENNLYFSEAPLPTQVHLKLLAEFEQDLASEAR